MSAYFTKGTPAMIALEEMVDRVGTRNVLYALSHICAAKAEHIQDNWQDRTTAGVWNRRANLINRLLSKLEAA